MKLFFFTCVIRQNVPDFLSVCFYLLDCDDVGLLIHVIIPDSFCYLGSFGLVAYV